MYLSGEEAVMYSLNVLEDLIPDHSPDFVRGYAKALENIATLVGMDLIIDIQP